jgi:hypothetical protein
MRGYSIASIALLSISVGSLPVLADDLPTLNVTPLCHGITDQSSLQEGLTNVTFDECMKAEQADRQQLGKEWSSFSAADKQHCVTEVKMGGESSYTELITCLEMARDVRMLQSPTQQNQKN